MAGNRLLLLLLLLQLALRLHVFDRLERFLLGWI